MPTPSRLREFVQLELDLGGIDQALALLIRDIQRTGLAGSARSCLELREARLAVRRALTRLSKPIAAASAAFDRERGVVKAPPPF